MVTEEMRRLCKSVFGQAAQFFPAHGMTEGGGTIGYNEHDGDDAVVPATDGGILSVGRVQPGCKIRIVDTDTQMPVKIGEKGDLHLCSHNIITEYMENRAADDFYQLGDNRWFKTGDLAMMDGQGFIYVMGRSKDIIKFHGISLSPSVLEGALNKDKEIQVKVLGLAEAQHGEVPVAVVKCTASKQDGIKERLVRQSVEYLGEDYALHHVYFVEELGLKEFPLNSTGKVERRQLLEAIKRTSQRSQ